MVRTYRAVGVYKYNCEECGTPCAASRNDARFCKPCVNRRKSGNYEDRQKGVCPDCGGPRARRNVEGRCRKCDGKQRSVKHVATGNPNWKGGRTRDKSQGYILVRNPRPGYRHPYQLEHVFLWEQANGPVPKGWHVHHLNGVKDDNRLENLVAMSKSDHHKNHHEPWERRIRELEAKLR